MVVLGEFKMATGNFILMIIWGISIVVSIPIILVMVAQLIQAIVDYCRWVRIGKYLYENNYFKNDNKQSDCKGESQKQSTFTEVSKFERWNKLAEAGYRYECGSDKNDDAINNPQQVYINPISYFKELYRTRKSKTTIRESNHCD